MNTHIKLLLAGVTAAALALMAGCHHSDDGGTAAPASTDAYTNQVSGVVAGPNAQSETADPAAVSGTSPITSETAQPIAVNVN
jgi:nitrous oxide reductase accessory protein NosL